jgi:hypothetical protein
MVALDKKVRIEYSATRKPLNRSEALAMELKTIARLLRKGYWLTNSHHNPFRHNDTNKAVSAVLGKVLTPRA